MNNKKLKELRESKKLTQEEIAAELGVGKYTYRSYEQGIKNPSLPVLKLMANLFKCSTDELI